MYQFRWGFKVLLSVTLAAASAQSVVIAQDTVPKTDNNETNTLLEEANRYYDATLFNRAIPVLQELLSTLHSNAEQRARVRLSLGH